MLGVLPQSSPMTRGFQPLNPESNEAIGRRLSALRIVLDKSQEEMQVMMGVGHGNSLWSDYENGNRRISMNHALGLCRSPELPGMTLEWIYKGVPIFNDLMERVRAKERELQDEAKKPPNAPHQPRRKRAPN